MHQSHRSGEAYKCHAQARLKPAIFVVACDRPSRACTVADRSITLPAGWIWLSRVRTSYKPPCQKHRASWQSVKPRSQLCRPLSSKQRPEHQLLICSSSPRHPLTQVRPVLRTHSGLVCLKWRGSAIHTNAAVLQAFILILWLWSVLKVLVVDARAAAVT